MHTHHVHEPAHEPRKLHRPHPGPTDILAMNVERTRKELGLSQIKLGERAQIAGHKIHEIEASNANPTLGEINRLAVALGISVCELFTLHPPKA